MADPRVPHIPPTDPARTNVTSSSTVESQTTAPGATSTNTMSETTRTAGAHPGIDQPAAAPTAAGGSSVGAAGAQPVGQAVPTQEKKGGVSGLMAKVHGAGEELRGKAGKVADRAANDPEGVARDEAVEQTGRQEIHSGRFSQATKERELSKEAAEKHRHV